MRIATFNLENLGATNKDGVELEERSAILRPQLERLRADIVCLQEINGQRRPGEPQRSLGALDDLLQTTRYQHYHRCASQGPLGHGLADVHNLVILSRYPIRAHTDIRHGRLPPLLYQTLTSVPRSAAPEPVLFDRPILMAEIVPEQQQPIFVFNVHLRAPLAANIAGQKQAPFVWNSVRGWAEGYFLSGLKRTGQALELRLAVDDLLDAENQCQIAVCGDFNAADHETPLKILVGSEEDTGNGHLAGRSLVVLDRSIARDRRFSVLHHGRPQMLDHILASRALTGRLIAVECQNEALGDEVVCYGRIQHSVSSYHAPVVAEFAA